MPDDNQDSGVSSLPVDPNTGVPVLTISPSSPLPVEQPTYDPATDVPYPTSAPVVDTDQTSGPLAKLFGLAGNERYQTWPEKLVRSALTAPADAIAGKMLPTQISDDPSNVPDTEVGRALDMASLAGVGPLAVEPGAASLGSGMVRQMATNAGNEDLAYLLKPKSAIDIIGKETGDIKSNGISNLKVQDAPDGYMMLIGLFIRKMAKYWERCR